MRSLPRGICVVLASAVSFADASPQSRDPLENPRKAVIGAYEQFRAARERLRADSVVRAVLPRVRNYAGLAVRADTTQLPDELMRAFDRAFELAHTNARRLLGTDADTILSGGTVSIVANDEVSPSVFGRRMMTLATEGIIGAIRVTEIAYPPDVDRLALRLDEWYGHAIAHRLPPQVGDWLKYYVSMQPQQQTVYAATYLTLARYPTQEPPECLRGSLLACQVALSLTPRGDTLSATLAYTEDVTRLRRRGTQSPEMQRCLSLRTIDACREARPGADFPQFKARPTSAEARRDLFRDALLRGGPGAFGRLARTPTPDVATALTVAANAPVDTVVAQWRARVLAAQPRSPAPNGFELFSGVVLCGALLGLSIGRRP